MSEYMGKNILHTQRYSEAQNKTEESDVQYYYYKPRLIV